MRHGDSSPLAGCRSACQLPTPTSLDAKSCLLQTASSLLTAAAGETHVWTRLGDHDLASSGAKGLFCSFPRTLAQSHSTTPTYSRSRHVLRCHTDVSLQCRRAQGLPFSPLPRFLSPFTVSLCAPGLPWPPRHGHLASLIALAHRSQDVPSPFSPEGL